MLDSIISSQSLSNCYQVRLNILKSSFTSPNIIKINMSDTKAGNSFIFWLFTLLNMLLIVLGLGISAAAVYLWTLTKSANYFTLSFLGLGVFLAMIATCAFCMRRSTVRLSLYILILLIICIVQTTGTILLIVKRDQVVDWWMDHIDEKSQDAFQKAKEEMENNINITQ